MYNNIGGKIKVLAKSAFIVETIASVIAGIVFLFDYETVVLGLIIIIAGPLVAWVSSWLLYGFGELIDKVTEIACNTRGYTTQQNTSPTPQPVESQKQQAPIPSTFKATEIMDIPKRNK